MVLYCYAIPALTDPSSIQMPNLSLKGFRVILSASSLTRYGFVFLLLFLYSCASQPYRYSNKQYRKQAHALAKSLEVQPVTGITSDSIRQPDRWIGTVNFGLRKPNFVVIHHTAQQFCEKTLQTFTESPREVSAHYVICADGTLYHMLHDQLRAWHAGAGKWGQVTDVNSVSIGIELDNDGLAPYREAQLQVLLTLLDTLKQRYRIPAANFIGHADIAPGRKVDPGINFSWERLAKKGFGLWYGDTLSLILPESFDARTALKIIGYDVHDQTAAIQSFRLHFMASQRKGELLPEEKKILYALQLKSME